MIGEEFQKESVLIWSVDVDHPDCSRVCHDLVRFETTISGNEAGFMTFLSWGVLIILDEALGGDLEMKLLTETEWGKRLLSEARRQSCNQIQIIAAYRLPSQTQLEVIN